MDKIGDLTLGKVLENLLSLFLILAGVAVFGSLLWAGYLFITSEGQPDKIQVARKSLTYSIIGIFVIGSMYIIMTYLKSIIP